MNVDKMRRHARRGRSSRHQQWIDDLSPDHRAKHVGVNEWFACSLCVVDNVARMNAAWRLQDVTRRRDT